MRIMGNGIIVLIIYSGELQHMQLPLRLVRTFPVWVLLRFLRTQLLVRVTASGFTSVVLLGSHQGCQLLRWKQRLGFSGMSREHPGMGEEQTRVL